MFRICFLEINWTGDTTIRWNFPGTLVIVILRFKGIVDVGVFFFFSIRRNLVDLHSFIQCFLQRCSSTLFIVHLLRTTRLYSFSQIERYLFV